MGGFVRSMDTPLTQPSEIRDRFTLTIFRRPKQRASIWVSGTNKHFDRVLDTQAAFATMATSRSMRGYRGLNGQLR